MGRCNNRRTQQAAAELRNTPSRARFSSGPPKKNKGKAKSGGSGGGRGGRGGRGGAATAAVVEKLSKRVEQKQSTSSSTETSITTTATTATKIITKRYRHPLANVDISKLDELVVPEESLQEVMKLLSDLNVKVVEAAAANPKEKNGNRTTTNDDTTSVNDANANCTGNNNDNGISVADKEQRLQEHPIIFNIDNDEVDNDYCANMKNGRDEFGGASHQFRNHRSNGGYEEHDEDFYEESYDVLDDGGYTPARMMNGNGIIEEEEEEEEENDDDSDLFGRKRGQGDNCIDEEKEGSQPEILTTLDKMVQAREKFRHDTVFLHLTTRLSFSNEIALLACQAIEDMVPHEEEKAIIKDNSISGGGHDHANPKQERKQQAEKMAFAMDWLCLHMNEEELTAGFKTNPNMTSPIILMGTGRTKPIPHPSISVAPKITSDRDWKRSILIQERVIKFLPLGFLHSETYSTFQDYSSERLEQESSKVAMEDDEALRLLLATLERETLETSENFTSCFDSEQLQKEHTQGDLDYAASERSAEEEALAAIYDDHFQIFNRNGHNNSLSSSTGQYRYKIDITLSESLKEPARSEKSSLHVFVRPGYPAFEPPLLFFHNPTLPPSLLRRVNMELCRLVHDKIGDSCVFEVVNYLSTELLTLQEHFMKEQRSKELEAEQLRLRREAGHVIDEVEYDEEAKLGRRQRAKLKAKAKAFEQPEIAQQGEMERLVRQDAQRERIREENKNFRFVMAERAIKKRENDRQEEEMNNVSRAAMNTAFIEGASVEQAREAAEKAKLEYMREHGLIDKQLQDADGSEDADREAHKSESIVSKLSANENGKENDNNEKRYNIPVATPTTTAFMERLREMYSSAAKEKATGGDPSIFDLRNQKQEEREIQGYHLNPAEEENIVEDDAREIVKFPRPVAVPVGELARVMEDVISTQKEQPWLIAPEARAPEAGADISEEELTMTTKMTEISKALKEENDRKYKAALQWRKKNNRKSEGNKGQKGFTPQRFNKMLLQRERLPAHMMRDEIVSTITANQVTVVSGDTGCGKTTQVPQLILDEMIKNGIGAQANIIVTQPRRISAIGVSERIADERCEPCGETCGYSIMLERKSSRKTRLLLCTTGILLRRLQCDPDLASVSHVFVDEVHERDLNTDFLLIILRELLNRRKTLKVVLMSATLNAQAFSDYFGGCAVISIPGRAHPVKEYRLEDVLQLTGYEVQEDSDYALKDKDKKLFSKSALRKMYYPKYNSQVIHSLSLVNESIINYELLSALLEKICQNEDEGSILVFLPGIMEITKAIEEMYKTELFQSPAVRICPLHSSLSTAEQTAVFDVPPDGVRKIVVSTNIAETSITIEDCVYVVDCGRVKENRKDEVNETPALVECWVSRASAKQRRGRAGRVRPGIAYHMFSSHTNEHVLQDYQLPEMLRVGLEDLVLQILILDLGQPTHFLGRALNPPTEMSMRNSLKLLEELGAVECQWGQIEDESGSLKLEEPKAPKSEAFDPLSASCMQMEVSSELTALGFHLATLPVDPRVGKMMIYGALFGCIEPALTIAASMSARNPFMSPFDKRDEANAARKQFAEDGSDHLAILRAFEQWKEKHGTAAQKFLVANFLSRQTLFQLEDLRKQFANLLVSIGFLPPNFRLEGIGRSGHTNSGRNNGIVADAENANSIANVNSKNVALVKAVLCAGLYPNIIVAPQALLKAENNKEACEFAFQSLNKGEVHLHPSTIAFKEKRLDSRYCCYHEMVKTSKTYVRDCTTVSPFALVLFGGTLIVYQDKGVATVDEWLKFRIKRKASTLVKHLRAQMESMLLRKIVSPQDDVTGSPVGKALIQSISTLLQRETNDKQDRNDGSEIVRPWRQSHDSQEQERSGRGVRGRGRGRGGRGRGRGRGVSSGRGRSR